MVVISHIYIFYRWCNKTKQEWFFLFQVVITFQSYSLSLVQMKEKKVLRASQQTFVLMKTSFVFVFRRRLQDVLIKTNMFALALRLQDVFKTSWSRPIYLSWPYVFKTFSRRLQDIFKTSSRSLQGVFNTSSRRFEDVFKMSSRHFQDVPSS